MITLITTDNCPNCMRTKMKLSMKGIKFNTIHLKREELTDEVRAELREKYPHSMSFPILLNTEDQPTTLEEVLGETAS